MLPASLSPPANSIVGIFICTVDNRQDNPQGILRHMEQPKNTGKFAPGNPGKPKGALSKVTRSAKEAIAYAAEGLGGADRLVEWAKEAPENEKAFWTAVYPKLLPLQVNGSGENGEHLVNGRLILEVAGVKAQG